jgi:hypothetical protein
LKKVRTGAIQFLESVGGKDDDRCSDLAFATHKSRGMKEEEEWTLIFKDKESS